MSNRYWVPYLGSGTGIWSDVNHWSTSSGSSGGSSIPTSADDCYFDANSFTSAGQTVTLDINAVCKTMNWSNVTNNPTFNENSKIIDIYGSLTLVSGMTNTENGTYRLLGTTSGKTITTAGKRIKDFITGDYSSWTLNDALTVLNTFNMTAGTLNTNNQTITTKNFTSTSAFIKSFILGNSTINVSGDFNFDGSNTTMVAGTSLIRLNGNGFIFAGGGLTYNNVEFTGSPIVVRNSNTFNDLKLTAGKTVIGTIGTIQTVNTLSGNGTSGNPITIQSTVAGTPFTINKTSEEVIKRYYSIKDCIVTGGATFYALSSTNVSGNTGWIFNTFSINDETANIIFESTAIGTVIEVTKPTTLQDFFSVIHSGIIQPKARITFLRREDESPYFEITGDIIDGNLNITKTNGVKRSCSITLQNLNSSTNYINQYKIWVNSKFMLELGLYIPSAKKYHYIPQGIFVARNPQVVSFNSGSTITIDGNDKFSLLDGSLGGKLIASYIVPVSTDINTAIRSILAEYLDTPRNIIPIDAKKPILQTIVSPDAITTPYTIRKELGGTYGDILLELNDINSRNMFYNTLGHLVCEEDKNDAIKSSIWDFSDNEFTYLGSTYSYQFEELYNMVKVIGDNINGKVYKATATNTNPQSNTNIDKIGVKLADPIESAGINTTALAQKRADYELKKLNALQSAISLECINGLYHLDVDNVITLTDSKLGLNKSRFLITDISIPFSPNSSMTISAVKTDELVLGGF